MLRHVVMWRFLDSAEGKTKAENMKLVKESLLALRGRIGEIRHMEIGEDVLHSDMSFDMGLIIDFDDADALYAYKNDPEHVKISQYVKKVRSDRATVDWEY